MRRSLHLILFLTISTLLQAQLPNGSTAPNWTSTDINGNTHTLYTYLDQGKVVFLDFFATWCGPCWNYHQTHAFENLYQQYGPPGSNQVMAFSIEGDGSTTINDIYGTGPNTIGNWTSGISYPIIDDATLPNPYNVNYYPTIYGICPDYSVTEVGQVGTASLHNFATNCPAVAPSASVTNVTHVNCFGQATGAIELAVSGNFGPYSYTWSNGAASQNVYGLQAGTYNVTVTGSNGGNVELGPIFINQPTTPVNVGVQNITHAGCNGVPGSITVLASGGTAPHFYTWSNGFSGPLAVGLTPGMYDVTVSDLNACVTVLSNIEIFPPLPPTADGGSDASLNCDVTSVDLDGSNSSSSIGLTYSWSTTNGNIVSGGNTLTPEVNESGTYLLTVIDPVTTCLDEDEVLVTIDTLAPTSNAGMGGMLDCAITSLNLNGTASTGSNISLEWQTSNGNIVSGANTLTPEVDESGTYTLIVTDDNNGCSAESSTDVAEDLETPEANAVGGELNCDVTSVELSGNSATAGVLFEWSGPNGFSSIEQNPITDESGIYTLTVTATNGCTAAAEATVTEDTTEPNVSTQGATLTCVVGEVELSGNSSTTNVLYEWSGPNGFSSTEQNPTVNESGIYVLTVIGGNGCTAAASADVVENNTAPIANAGAGEVLNCNATSVLLNGTNSSTGNNFEYLWTTDDGHILSGETSLTPTVDQAGTYNLQVTNLTNGCTEMSATNVVENSTVSTSISSQINVDCNGNANGSATIIASGGNGTLSVEWSNGATTTSVEGLAAGTYGVTVSDDDGCTAVESMIISEPTVLNTNAQVNGETALGENNGSASVNPQGGTGDYTYEWNNGETTQTIEGLNPANYSVIVTDENGCTATETVTVNSFNCIVNADIAGQNISCNGMDDGEVSLSFTLGSEPYTYEWNNGETTPAIANLAAGAYAVTATDGNNCPVFASITITEPQLLAANATSTNETEASANNGTATAAPTGGVQPYTYEWNNGANSASISNLEPATYTVTITDANACEAIQEVDIVPFNCLLEASITSVNLTCNGANDGQATVSLTGGTAPYEITWSNEANTTTVSNLSPGLYEVSITDNNNCPTVTSVTIAEPLELTTQVEEVVPTECENVSNGTATVSAVGGTGNLTYEWSNGATGMTAENLAVGVYEVVIKDENACVTTREIEIIAVDEEAPTIIVQDVEISLDENGLVNITPEILDNGSYDNCAIESMDIDQSAFECASAGVHQVLFTVTDVNGLTSNELVNVTVIDDAAPTVLTQNVTLPLDQNGEVIVTATMLNNGSFDNCGIDEMYIDQGVFTCDLGGVNNVTLVVVDFAGNIGTAVATVTILDEEAPIALAHDLFVSLDANGEATINADMIDNDSYDNCNIAEKSLNQTTFTCDQIGDNIVTLTVTDDYGNTSSTTAIVTVEDKLDPILTCPSNIAITCSGLASYDMPTVEDNCEAGAPELVEGLLSGSVFPVGTTIVTWEYTDAGGNATTCSFDVEIAEPMSSTASSTNVSCFGSSDGEGSIEVLGGVGAYSYEWSDGQTTQTATNLAAGNYMVTATDALGCITTQSVTIGEPSAIIIFVDNVNDDLNMSNSGAIAITVSGGVQNYSFVWTLNGEVISNNEDPNNLAAGDYIVEITDENGCLFTSQVITVEALTNINEPVWATELRLTPNPTRGKIQVILPNHLIDLATLEAYDVSGKQLMLTANEIAAHTFEMNFEKEANGVYLLKIRVGEEVVTRRIVVQH